MNPAELARTRKAIDALTRTIAILESSEAPPISREPRNNAFLIKLSATEKTTIRNAAARAGLDMSEYMRRRSLGEPIENSR